MRIAITGADGFIGRNLTLKLRELGFDELSPIVRGATPDELRQKLRSADFVFHLAGVNRPSDPKEFQTGNAGLTEQICGILKSEGRKVPVAFASSTQALLDNPYGASKRLAEDHLAAYGRELGTPVVLFRLTNVFGKWARPNYNSVVATFCHNIARDLPIAINDPGARLRLVYVDDVVAAFIRALQDTPERGGFVSVEPEYETTVGELANQIEAFAKSRKTLVVPPVGTGLQRALYSTYVSYLPEGNFAYAVPVHADQRGEFVEMLKTGDSGQFSYFTARPGITRGGHYHHTKTEKFLVIRGTARFGFRNVNTGATYDLVTRGGEARIVETAPGWAHDVTNIGDDELVVMLWANEIFNPGVPDTIPAKVLA